MYLHGPAPKAYNQGNRVQVRRPTTRVQGSGPQAYNQGTGFRSEGLQPGHRVQGSGGVTGSRYRVEVQGRAAGRVTTHGAFIWQRCSTTQASAPKCIGMPLCHARHVYHCVMCALVGCVMHAPVGCVMHAPVGCVMRAPVGCVMCAPVGCATCAPVGCVMCAPVGCAMCVPVGCAMCAPVGCHVCTSRLCHVTHECTSRLCVLCHACTSRAWQVDIKPQTCMQQGCLSMWNTVTSGFSQCIVQCGAPR